MFLFFSLGRVGGGERGLREGAGDRLKGGGVRKRAGRRSYERAVSEREMQNVNFCHSLIQYSLKIHEPKILFEGRVREADVLTP